MPHNSLPDELRAIAACPYHLKRDGQQGPECPYCRERESALLAAIPVIARESCKEVCPACKKGNTKQYEHNGSCLAILRRWELEEGKS